MRRIFSVLVIVAVAALTACNLTPQTIKKMTNDQLCSEIGMALQEGDTSDVGLLLDEFKLRREGIDQAKCRLLEKTGENSVLPYPYYDYMY